MTVCVRDSTVTKQSFVICFSLTRRHAGRAVRSDTLLSTVKSIQRGDFPTRRAAAARAAPSTPRLVSAARVGPVVYGLLLTFRGGGYG